MLSIVVDCRHCVVVCDDGWTPYDGACFHFRGDEMADHATQQAYCQVSILSCKDQGYLQPGREGGPQPNTARQLSGNMT